MECTSSTNKVGPGPSCIFQIKGVDIWKQHWGETQEKGLCQFLQRWDEAWSNFMGKNG